MFFTFRFQAATSTWLTQAARTQLAGGAGSWLSSLAGSPFDSSPWRKERGALWDIGPHALSVLVPALGPVVSVQAGAGLRDTVHLVLTHESGRRVDGDAVAHGGAAVGRHRVLRARRRRPAGAPARRPAQPNDAFAVAVDELTAAAVTGGAHPCDVAFGRDVVAVLETAARALESGCREPVAG